MEGERLEFCLFPNDISFGMIFKKRTNGVQNKKVHVWFFLSYTNAFSIIVEVQLRFSCKLFIIMRNIRTDMKPKEGSYF